MKFNKFLILLFIFISLIAINAVSAAEDVSDVISSDFSSQDVQCIDMNENVLADDTNDVQLIVTTSNTPYNENATIEVSLSNKNASSNFNGTVVNIYMDGDLLKNVSLDSQGKASYIIPARTYDVGKYFIMATYETDSAVLFNHSTFNITKVTPIVSVENVTAKTGEAVTIPFNVTDNKGKRLSGGVIVTIQWENDSLSKYTEIYEGRGNVGFNIGDLIGIFSNGTGNSTFDFSKLLNGTNITMDFSKLFNGSNTTFDISKLFNGTNMTFDISSLFNGTNTTIDLSKLFNGTNTTVDISSFINGTNTTTVDLSALLNGTNMTFDISKLFNSTTTNTTFDFSKLFNGTNTTFDFSKLFNGTTTFDISHLMNGTISIPTFDRSNTKTNTNSDELLGANSTATFDISDLFNGTNRTTSSFNISDIIKILMGGNKTATTFNYIFTPGTYNITVTYLPNRNYNKAVNTTAKLIITPRAIISAEDVVMYYKDGSRYAVNLTDFEGKALSNETVTFTINGESYNRTTDENGSASIAINLDAGNYTASVTYTATGDPFPVVVENNVTVLSTILGDDLVKVYKNATQYHATFLDSEGNPLVNTDVEFNINGVMYTRTTDKNGVASLNINLEQATYIITATNPKNGEKHSNNITVLSKIANTKDLVKYYKNDSQYIVTILGDDGKAVGAGEIVTFNINGVMYTRTTNESGQAQLNINLQPGNYIVTAEYKDCKISNTIDVLPVLNGYNMEKSYGDSKPFAVNLLDGQGKALANATIKFNINGLIYERTTDVNGTATLNINLQPGEYIITSSYNDLNIANKITIKA